MGDFDVVKHTIPCKGRVMARDGGLVIWQEPETPNGFGTGGSGGTGNQWLQIDGEGIMKAIKLALKNAHKESNVWYHFDKENAYRVQDTRAISKRRKK